MAFDNVKVGADTRDEVYATLNIELKDRPNIPATLKAKVDTGAQGNVLPLRTYNRMYPSYIAADGLPKRGTLENTDTVLTAYNGQPIPQYSTLRLRCSHAANKCDAIFFVADTPGPAIIGLPSCRDLNLVVLNCEITQAAKINTKDDLQRQYPDRFEGIGKFRGDFHITLDATVTPVIHAVRRCSIHLKDEVKAELDNMEELGVIERVTEPTDWVSSIVYSRKPSGKLRICLDPKDLNKAIKRPHYHTPTLEEITHKLAGSVMYSKLDARHGYWEVQLYEESRLLTTFNSPFGRYCYKRMPFGLNLSQDVFQERMDNILEHCPGTISIADDIGVFGSSEGDHDENLHNLMRVAQAHGLIFNAGKCEIKRTNMKFFGLVFDAEGVHPDPQRIADIKEMKTPQNATQLQEYLGIATYMSPFIAKLSQHTAALRDLVKKDVEFVWTESHETAFERTKALICRQTTLKYFNPSAESVIQVDASGRGLGAVLMQNGKPIAFASKSLSDADTRYANIEREMLAVVFGCERFHTYVFGKSVTIESDHRPLEMIHLKNLSAAPQRLQRMLLRIQPYAITIRYRPGKEMAMADALSRQPCDNKEQIQLDVQLHFVQFSTQRLEILRDETRQDAELMELQTIIHDGWPEKRKEVPAEKLHAAHQGIEKTRLRARTCVYWSGINGDIEEMISKYGICQEMQHAQRPEPLLQHEVPTRPWQNVGTELFAIGNRNYLIVSDYYSKFPLVKEVTGAVTSQAVIRLTKEIFSEQGVPATVYSDNGSQYSSSEYRRFSEQWEFNHINSSPHFPQSNGFIERQIQTVKRTMQKAGAAKIDMAMAMLILRSTPIDSQLPSPAELLYARKLHANVPIKMIDRRANREDVHERLLQRQLQQKSYHESLDLCQNSSRTNT